MNPLFGKYFHGELTESEEAELDSKLKGSQDAAWEFGQEAEENYVRYGLPEPRLPGKIGWTAFMGASKIGIVLLLLVALLLFWRVRGCKPPSTPPAPPPTPTVTVPKTPAKKNVSRPVATPTVTAAPEKAMTEETRVKATGSNLRVVVKRETAGPVAVNVYDAKGLQVRLLFEGILQPGRWAFEWDGRSQDGRLVAPGKYRIQVKSEGNLQSRVVEIR